MDENIEKRLLKRIRGGGRGSVFMPNHFSDVSPRTAIDKALSRLASSGSIRRIARGVYNYPVVDPLLNQLNLYEKLLERKAG